MSIESRSRQYGVVFDHWQIKDFLGSGSGGKSAVFRLSRIDSTWGKSALKVINLIEEKGNINSISDYRRKEYEQAKAECKKAAEQEVRLMDELHGNTNIVDYLDHKFVDWSDETGFGCDMLIRMELLEDLRGKLRDGHMYSEKEVLKIGRDICAALVLCHQKGILHRDIKPENIFINADGNFKLGDFGVSRILSAAPTAVASTGIGTPEYAAPEQFTGRHDKRVDIYSLGLVLYELTNGNKLPFASTGYARPVDVERRQMGEPLPAPCNASKAFTSVILKACAHKKEDRYQTAEELLSALDRLSGTSTPLPSKASSGNTTQKATAVNGGYATERASANEMRRVDQNTTVPAQRSVKTVPAGKYSSTKKAPARKGLVIGIIAVLLVCIGIGVLYGMQVAADKKAIAIYIDEAESFAASFNYEGAIAKIEEGINEFPNSADLKAKKDTYNAALTEQIVADIILEADALAKTEDYQGALGKVNAGLLTYPESESLQNKADEYSEALNAQIKQATLAEAATFAEAGDYASAINLIKTAQDTYGDDPDYQNAYAEYLSAYNSSLKKEAIDKANQFAGKNDYVNAIRAIEEAITSVGSDEELTQELLKHQSTYVADICTEADSLVDQGNYDEATALVNTALTVVKNDADLKAKLSDIEAKKPKYLVDVLDPFRTDDYEVFSKGVSAKMGGVARYNGFMLNVYGWNGQSCAVYNLNKEYARLTGITGYVDGKTGDGKTWDVYIYTDDVLAFTCSVTPGDLPQEFSIDLTGVTKLEFKTSDARGFQGYIGFADLCVMGVGNTTQSDVQQGNNDGSKYLVDIIDPFQHNDYEVFKNGSSVKMGGVSRYNGFTLNVYGWNDQSYAAYNLNSSYQKLSGLVGYVDDRLGDGKTWEVFIYTDDVLAFTCTVEPGNLPQEFSIDLTGVKKLEFKTTDGRGFQGYIGFANLQIS